MLRPFGKSKNCSLGFYILNFLSGGRLNIYVSAADWTARNAYIDILRIIDDEQTAEREAEEQQMQSVYCRAKMAENKLQRVRENISIIRAI